MGGLLRWWWPGVCVAMAGCRLFAVYLPEGPLPDTGLGEHCTHLVSDALNTCPSVGWGQACVSECVERQSAIGDTGVPPWHQCWHAAERSCEALKSCLTADEFRCVP